MVGFVLATDQRSSKYSPIPCNLQRSNDFFESKELILESVLTISGTLSGCFCPEALSVRSKYEKKPICDMNLPTWELNYASFSYRPMRLSNNTVEIFISCISLTEMKMRRRFGKTLEDKANELAAEIGSPQWDTSIPAILRREIALTVEQLDQLKFLRQDQQRRLLRLKCNINTEIMQQILLILSTISQM